MPRRADNAASPITNRNGQGGGLGRLQRQQSAEAGRWRVRGLCNVCATAAAERRRLLCQDCIEIYDNERTTSGPA